MGISEIVNGRLFERVHPCLVKKKSYIGNVDGVMNAVILEGKPVGESILQGEGAGPGPTSSALMSDLLSILRGNIKNPLGASSDKRKFISSFNINNYENYLFGIDYIGFENLVPLGSDIIKFDLDLNLKSKFGRSGNYKGPKARYHDIQVDNKGNIYLGDILMLICGKLFLFHPSKRI